MTLPQPSAISSRLGWCAGVERPVHFADRGEQAVERADDGDRERRDQEVVADSGSASLRPRPRQRATARRAPAACPETGRRGPRSTPRESAVISTRHRRPRRDADQLRRQRSGQRLPTTTTRRWSNSATSSVQRLTPWCAPSSPPASAVRAENVRQLVDRRAKSRGPSSGPATTGYGTNRAMLPRRSTPKATCRMPRQREAERRQEQDFRDAVRRRRAQRRVAGEASDERGEHEHRRRARNFVREQRAAEHDRGQVAEDRRGEGGAQRRLRPRPARAARTRSTRGSASARPARTRPTCRRRPRARIPRARAARQPPAHHGPSLPNPCRSPGHPQRHCAST